MTPPRRTQKRRKVSAPPPVVRARSGQRLQLDRGLRLVGDLVAHAEQRGDRVEQPAHAGRRHAADAPVQLLAQHARALPRSSRRPAASAGSQPRPQASQVGQRRRGRACARLRRRRAAASGAGDRPARSRGVGPRRAPRRPRSSRRCRSRCRRKRRRRAGSPQPSVLGQQRRPRGRGGAGPPRTGRPAACRVAHERVSVPRVAVGRQRGGPGAVQIAEALDRRGRTRCSVSRFSMSPRCWLTARRAGRWSRQNVFFSSPPTARTVATARPRSTGSGA